MLGVFHHVNILIILCEIQCVKCSCRAIVSFCNKISMNSWINLLGGYFLVFIVFAPFTCFYNC